MFGTTFDQMHCPACSSSDIELVTYDAVFPGADLRTKVEDVPVPEDVRQIGRDHTESDRISLAAADRHRRVSHVVENTALLAASSPEFAK
jgi:hypothetical protein